MVHPNTLNSSQLHDETTFYQAFLADLRQSEKEVIIESPFITSERMVYLWPTLRLLNNRNVKIIIVTRDPKEHEETYDSQAENEIQECEGLGIQVLLSTGNHHRKLAVIDRRIVWEGSLNILSQLKSREFMRRINDRLAASQLLQFIRYDLYLA